MISPYKDCTGQRFGRLVALQCTGKNTNGEYCWLCACDCGNTKEVRGNALRNRTKSCGCLHSETTAAFNRRRKGVAKLPDNTAQFNRVMKNYRHNAAERGYTFLLDANVASGLVIQDCYYCGAPGEPFNGMDRVDNSRGYVDGNLVPCCKTCNIAKNTMTLAEFRAWAVRLYGELMAKMPAVDFSRLPEYEKVDGTSFTEEVACVAGQCEI